MLRCSRLLVAVASISGAASAAFVPSGFGAVQMGLHSRGRGASVRSPAQSLGKEGARGICMAGETIIFDVTNTLMELKEPVGTTYARIASGHGIAVDDEAEIEAAFRREFGKMQPLQYIDVAGDRHLAEVKEREWWKILVRRVLDCDESPVRSLPHSLSQFSPCLTSTLFTSSPSYSKTLLELLFCYPFQPLPHPMSAQAYDQCFDECFHHFGTSSAWQLFPEVCDTLDALKLDGWRLGILSNWDVRLQTVVSQREHTSSLSSLNTSPYHLKLTGRCLPPLLRSHTLLETTQPTSSSP
jgi:FMN phosphatase YigB (HAD superfamily)